MVINSDMSTRPEVLVNVTRGNLIESTHHGHIAVADNQGLIIVSVGDPFHKTYMRSAAKPLQTLAVILSGAADHFGITPEELAVMSASHFGEEQHRETVKKILAKIGCDETHLLCGSTTSLKVDYALEMARNGYASSPLFSDCSGKHSGMLAICKYKGWSVENYTDPQHPLQRLITDIIAQMTHTKPEDIVIAIDGCGAPVHGLPMVNMATAFANLATPTYLPKEIAEACLRVYNAMSDNPFMIAGTGGFCTELIHTAQGKLIGKIGAEAIYLVASKVNRLGIALKLTDGNLWRIAPAVMQTIKELQLLDQRQLSQLKHWSVMENKNKHNQVVGSIFPAFRLL
ncbi:MAG TPA: asparaginase [Salinivirgaceae bacterium]|nr:asparaginase [Salinivirgaceae bacterium]